MREPAPEQRYGSASATGPLRPAGAVLSEGLPHAQELGTERHLAGIEEILRRGNAADRQLRTFNANRDVVEVVSDLADLTEAAVA